MNRDRRIPAGAVGVMLLLLVGGWLLVDRTPPSAHHPLAHPDHRPGLAIDRRPAPAPMPTPEPPPVAAAAVTNQPPRNAADLYREAFAALKGLSQDERGLLGDWKTNAVAPELCAKLKPIVALAQQAMATTNCDWGVKYEGFGTLLPHLGETRQLARALLWNASHCRQENAAGAGDDLLATLRLGQNSAEFLIGHLVNTAIQGMALACLGDQAARLPAAIAAELTRVLSDNSYDESLYRAMESEARGVDFEADRFATSTNDIRSLIQASGIEADKQFANMSQEQIVAKMREVAALERDYVRVMELPDTEYQAWLAKVQAAQQTNPLIDMLWPVMDRVTDRTRAMVVQRALAVAGLQVLASGPTVLTQYRDPASGQPFLYRPTATGFELSSTYQLNGKPVTVNFRY
jgi:hypothetical protein